MSSDKLPPSPEEARKLLWRKGNLQFKLHSDQLKAYKQIKENPNKIIVINSSRRWGKSTLMCILAVEQCLQHPESIVKFLAPEAKQIRTILRPIMRDVLKGCPGDLRPTFKSQEGMYKFPNGSEIQLAGSDAGNAVRLRGGNSHLCLVDEAGFISDLKQTVTSVLLPTTLTTKGKIILASTPPTSPNHDFVKIYLREAEIKGTLITKTIYDNPLLDETAIAEATNEYGGKGSIEFRRELMAEIIVDTKRAIIPEFTKEIQEETIREWDRPPFFDCYTAMDIGFRDLTAVIFAYYDFRNGKLIVEDEYCINGKEVNMNTDVIAYAIKEREKKLWTNPLTGSSLSPTLRVSDNDLLVINDLQTLHGLTFLPTYKDSAEASINFLRMLIGQKKVIISPKCINLIDHLKHGIWNKNRTDFERGEDGNHCDALDALRYLVRNINMHKNPYPPGYDILDRQNSFIRGKRPEDMKLHDNIKGWFGRRR